MQPAVIARKAPYAVNLEEGTSHLWCACGRSRNQPFCDSSHAGTGHEPKRFRARRTGTVYLCGCKRSKNPPFCDGSHRDLEAER